MHRSRAVLVVLVTVLAIPLLAGPASAGGPTSALLVVPGVGRTASLYTTDPAYASLADLVGAFRDDGAAGRVDRSGASHESGTGVTVTWLIHDVQVWRVDRIYLGAPGGPWISTQVAIGENGAIWDSPVAWHTATRGKELTLLLDGLGLLDGSAAGDSAPQPTTAAVPQPVSDPPADDRSAGTAGVLWGLGGLAVGLAVALLALRVRLRFGRTAGPPVESALLDNPGAGWGSPDELATPSRGTGHR